MEAHIFVVHSLVEEENNIHILFKIENTPEKENNNNNYNAIFYYNSHQQIFILYMLCCQSVKLINVI